MIVYLNGEFVPEERAVVSVFDRGFLYGDGLFETIRLFNGNPFRWNQHFDRLTRGAEFLKIEVPCSADSLRQTAVELALRNSQPDSVLRIAVSRGRGQRGYSIRGTGSPTMVMALFPVPDAVGGRKLKTSTLRLHSGDALARFKTSNRLMQILARAEAEDAGADEALILNTNGFVAEGSSSNVFWVEEDRVCTTPIESGILPGITRSVVFEICRGAGFSLIEKNARLEQLFAARGVFLSLSSMGIVEVESLDSRPLPATPVVKTLQDAYEELLKSETRG